MSILPTYPLYYTLRKKNFVSITDQSIVDTMRLDIIDAMKSLSKEKKEAVILLIAEHYQNSTGERIDVVQKTIPLPYGGKNNDTSASWDMQSFPQDLVSIIHKFVVEMTGAN